MKKYVISSCLSIFCFITAVGQNWYNQSSNPGEDFNAIHFPDSCIGYAFGTAGVISKTYNRGSRWETKNLTLDVEIDDGMFVSLQQGFITGKYNPSGNGFFCKTSNGANTWDIIDTTSFSNRLRALYFVNASTGWLVGNDEYIVKTTNG
ncbi:MAG: hypothetical protein JKX95_09180, partial [Bacteroidia bacterium]|nr:hypothetical protein [Bacteroidia bacterium]